MSEQENSRNERFVDEVVKNIDDESAQIRVLSALRKNYEQELKYGPSRRQITFGYVSQVAFAIVGVVFPADVW